MLYIFRHIAIRLWISILAGSLLVVTIFPLFSGQIGLNMVFWGASVSFLAIYFIGGWVSDSFGMNWVNSLMREAGIWERAGNFRRSEKIFKKAVSLFDSTLISPIDRRKKSRELSARMARFYLASKENYRTSEAFITTYLEAHPEDEEVSEIWLQNAENQENLLKTYDELAFKLGDAQPSNKNLQIMLARAYLLSERNDFPALKAYRRIIEDDAAVDRELLADIARRFFEDRRTDRWALKAYLAALKQEKAKTWLLKGIAVCVHGQKHNGRSSSLYKEAGALLSQIDAATLKKLRDGFTPPISAPEPKSLPTRRKSEILKTWLHTVIAGSFKMAGGLGNMAGSTRNASAKFYHTIKDHKLLKPALKWTAVGFAGAGLVILVVNTASHLIQTRETVEQEVRPSVEVEPVITDPFTIQVAAYLKAEHAEKFVAILKNQDLDAYYTKAKSTKSNWYQVRISHFPTKDDARAYGESLKSKGVIDDFYVANYQQP